MMKSILRQAAILVACLGLGAGYGLAQKKPGGAAGGQNAAAAPAASSGSAANAPFEVEMMSYSAMDAILDRLAQYACGVTCAGAATPVGANYHGILVLDSTALVALQAFDGFYANAETLKTAFNQMRGISGGGGAGIDDFADITNAISAAATASTSETASSFTIQDPTAALALLRHLQMQAAANPGCAPAYYGGVYATDTSNAEVNGQPLNSIDEELGTLAAARAQTLGTLISKAVSPKPADEKKMETKETGDTAEKAKPAAKPARRQVIGAVPCIPTRTVVAGSNPPVYAVSAQDPCITAYNNLDGTYNSFLAGLNTATAAALFGTTSAEQPMLGYT